jgi:hypothetical protein
MSNGSVLGAGSVVSFTPAVGWRAVYVGDGSLSVDVRPELVVPVVGWAVVVTTRSGWEMSTVMRPVMVLDGQLGFMPEQWELVFSENGRFPSQNP